MVYNAFCKYIGNATREQQQQPSYPKKQQQPSPKGTKNSKYNSSLMHPSKPSAMFHIYS